MCEGSEYKLGVFLSFLTLKNNNYKIYQNKTKHDN